MANAYVFTLQPTFTQGLIIGQFSILFLLVVILKYLFLDPVSDQPYKSSSYQPRIVRDESDETVSLDGLDKLPTSMSVGPDGEASNGVESADWINILLHQVSYQQRIFWLIPSRFLLFNQVVDAYRTKLRADLPGAEGDEVARRRVEKFANKMRPAAFLVPSLLFVNHTVAESHIGPYQSSLG